MGLSLGLSARGAGWRPSPARPGVGGARGGFSGSPGRRRPSCSGLGFGRRLGVLGLAAPSADSRARVGRVPWRRRRRALRPASGGRGVRRRRVRGAVGVPDGSAAERPGHLLVDRQEQRAGAVALQGHVGDRARPASSRCGGAGREPSNAPPRPGSQAALEPGGGSRPGRQRVRGRGSGADAGCGTPGDGRGGTVDGAEHRRPHHRVDAAVRQAPCPRPRTARIPRSTPWRGGVPQPAVYRRVGLDGDQRVPAGEGHVAPSRRPAPRPSRETANSAALRTTEDVVDVAVDEKEGGVEPARTGLVVLMARVSARGETVQRERRDRTVRQRRPSTNHKGHPRPDHRGLARPSSAGSSAWSDHRALRRRPARLVPFARRGRPATAPKLAARTGTAAATPASGSSTRR